MVRSQFFEVENALFRGIEWSQIGFLCNDDAYYRNLCGIRVFEVSPKGEETRFWMHSETMLNIINGMSEGTVYDQCVEATSTYILHDI